MAITNLAKALKLCLPSKPNNPSNSNDVVEEEIATPKATTKEDEFRQVFRYLDANNDGKISAEELSAYFASIGDTVPHEDAERIIRDFSNDSELLEFGEFVRMMEVRESNEVDDHKVLRQAFEVYEVEKGSGFITPEGLHRVLRCLGEVKSYQECEAMIKAFDLDGNGKLDFHEFAKMMS